MYRKGRKKETIRFIFKPNNGNTGKKICLAGDFTEWEPIRMRKQKNGEYAVTLPLSAGSYQYKFQVDEDWLPDPDNQANSLNEFGTLNSLAVIS